MLDVYNALYIPGDSSDSISSPWVLRFNLNPIKLLNKQMDIEFIAQKL